MRRRMFISTCLVVPMVAALPARAAGRDYLLATASPGGTFYPVGVALATTVKVALQASHGVTLTAVTTAGSGENVKLVREGELQFALLQGLFGHDGRTGSGAFAGAGPDDLLRSVTALWPNVEQFVVRADFLATGTIDDLLAMKGQRVVLGDVGSGTLASSRVLLGHLGVDIERDFRLVHLGYGPAADALQSGDVAAIALPAGLPTKSLARLKAEMGDGAAILSFTAEQAARADGGLNLWHSYVIPADTYPGQPAEIPTIAQPNFLAVRGDIGAEDVYLITAAIYGNLPLLRSMHEAAEAISLDNALLGLPVPLHPGAAQFFREKGLDIPSRLLAD